MQNNSKQTIYRSLQLWNCFATFHDDPLLSGHGSKCLIQRQLPSAKQPVQASVAKDMNVSSATCASYYVLSEKWREVCSPHYIVSSATGGVVCECV